MWICDCGMWIWDFGFWICDCGLWILSFERSEVKRFVMFLCVCLCLCGVDVREVVFACEFNEVVSILFLDIGDELAVYHEVFEEFVRDK